MEPPTANVLGIEAVKGDVLRAAREAGNVIVVAPPGAGKTTRLPPALLALDSREVLVLEPRRLAARLAARRVAKELGEPLGETVGYQIRFEEVGGPSTRLRFLTEGVLTRRLLRDPDLRRVGTVVLDEFHERHLDGDVALALLRRLQTTARPDLRLVVMSATLETDPVAEYLGQCPIVRAEGRLFPLDVRYTPHSAQPLEDKVANAVMMALREFPEGDVLVFLPGAAEIRKCQRTLASTGALVVPLHGDLSPAEQDRAVTPAAQRKVILSTNVAESSITIEGVRVVIDSGLARIASDSPYTGLSTTRVGQISQSSAIQRAGRAGRTGPGMVVRLYSADEFHRRPKFDNPEIQRRELSGVTLGLRTMGIRLSELPWFDPPPPSAVDAAEELLRRLRAIDDAGRVTELGREMDRFPLHPRLARLLVEAGRRRAAGLGAMVAAVLSADERLPPGMARDDDSDLIALAEGQLSGAANATLRQIRRMMTRGPQPDVEPDQGVLMATLAAYPDRVAKRRGGELLLAGGGAAVQADNSVVRRAPFVVAVDVEQRHEQKLPLVRLASRIEPEWLLDLFPDRVQERLTVEWNRQEERVEAVSSLVYDQLVIAESRSQAPSEQSAELLASKALEAGISRFTDQEQLDEWLARAALAHETGGIRSVGPDQVKAALVQLCYGLRSFRELENAAKGDGFLIALQQQLPPADWRRLEELAPARLRLANGRQARIRYIAGQPPWVASRLQDFFGMKQSPTIAGGRVPLVVHLLAPNQRPVQMTSDLAGFWERLYPQVRRELSRRYPRHAWPENPFQAATPDSTAR